MTAWADAVVRERLEWAPGLFTLKLDAELEPFEAGQWTNVALVIEGERVMRAYSLVSAPGEPPELYLSLVPGGRFTPRLHALRPGDPIEIERKPQGFFTLRWLPEAKELWMVATGTGLAPYLSMLRSGALWSRFERLVIVHGVRERASLSYRDEIERHAASRAGRLTYVPVVSREPESPGVLHGRVTTVLTSGALEAAAGLTLAADRSHVCLCGNPDMIKEMAELCAARGLPRHRQRRPGNVSSESFW